MEQISPVRAARPSPSTWLLAVLFAITPSLIKFLCYPRYIGSDDSYIHLQVARNLLGHHGWAVNPDHPVNLSTSPLFTILLTSLAALFHRAEIVPAMLASALACTIGLLAVFLHVWNSSEGNRLAAFFALDSLAFACNLWRWNGTVMETTFAFCTVALLLFVLHKGEISNRRCAAGTILLGLAVLLRPELFIFAVLTIIFRAFAQQTGRTRQTLTLIIGLTAPLVLWAIFAEHTFGMVLPSTLGAKTAVHFVYFNHDVLRQFAQLIILSLLWPAIATVVCLAMVRRHIRTLPASTWMSFATVVLIAGFYYLRTQGLESPGRYLLPLFPLLAVVAAQWVALAISAWPAFPWRPFVVSALGLHLVTCLTTNVRFIQPVLVSFQSEYFASTCNAANYLAGVSSPNTRVLVEIDIGVLSYCGNGRFFIEDGGGLASPNLAHLSVAQQITATKPDFVVESQGPSRNNLAPDNPQLREVWHNAYRGHGISSPEKLFVNIYAVQPSP